MTDDRIEKLAREYASEKRTVVTQRTTEQWPGMPIEAMHSLVTLLEVVAKESFLAGARAQYAEERTQRMGEGEA